MIKKIIKTLCSIFIIGTVSKNLAAQDMSNKQWKTDRMALLDSPTFLQALTRINSDSNDEVSKDFTQENVNNFVENLLVLLYAEQGEVQGDANFVHTETILTTIGSLMGFASQVVIHEAYVATGKASPELAFIVIETKNGDKYYYGDPVNEVLFESQGENPWKILSSFATSLGAKKLPDLDDIAGYTAGNLGNDNFGIPRLPSEHMPKIMPFEIVKKYWNTVRNLLYLETKDSTKWPGLLALSAGSIMIKTKENLPPETSMKILFESAIPMLHIDHSKIPNALLSKMNHSQ